MAEGEIKECPLTPGLSALTNTVTSLVVEMRADRNARTSERKLYQWIIKATVIALIVLAAGEKAVNYALRFVGQQAVAATEEVKK